MAQEFLISQSEGDLAGLVAQNFDFAVLQKRIDGLIQRYLSLGCLRDRLEELPQQFAHPQARPWKAIDWQAIAPEQVRGMSLPVFLAILQGAIDTEVPIRGYTQSSRQYLEQLHPRLAKFVGGTVDADGTLVELGLWEKEERQHAPALLKIYTQLSGQKRVPMPHSVRPYQPSQNPSRDLYQHGVHRVLTEYGATCLYLWLMAHSTGALQAVLEELTLDEINHMTKFWGFGTWAYPQTSLLAVGRSLLQSSRGKLRYQRDRSSLIGTLDRMTQVLHWSDWTWSNRASFSFTAWHTMQQLWRWHATLTPDYLNDLFGTPAS